MNRRKFITATGAAGLLAANGFNTATAAAKTPVKPALMKVGDQTAPTNETHLKYLARYSVRNICGYPEIEGDRIYATVEELNRMVDLASKCGISVDCTTPPFWRRVTSIKRSIRPSCWRKARSATATSNPSRP